MPPRCCARMAFRLRYSTPCCRDPIAGFPQRSEAALARSCRDLRRRFQFSVEDVFDPNARGRVVDDRRRASLRRKSRSSTAPTPPTTRKSTCNMEPTTCSWAKPRRHLTELCRYLLTSGAPADDRWAGQSMRAARAPLRRFPRLLPGSIFPIPRAILLTLRRTGGHGQDAHGYFSMNAVASRGCPYRCNWCAKPISGDKFHVRPAEAVAEEILRTERGVRSRAHLVRRRRLRAESSLGTTVRPGD